MTTPAALRELADRLEREADDSDRAGVPVVGELMREAATQLRAAARPPTEEEPALRRDAFRYRWLRAHQTDRFYRNNDHEPCLLLPFNVDSMSPEEVDKEMDKAMATYPLPPEAAISSITHPPEVARDAGRSAIYDAASKGFHISESCGPDRKYLHIIKFPDLDSLHAYEDAWRKMMVAERDSR